MSEIVLRNELHTRSLPCRLTPKENRQRCRELAGAVEEQQEAGQRLEMRKADVKLAKEALDAVTGRVITISEVINSNQETRSVDCETLLDYDERKVIARRLDTGDVVSVRSMTAVESQANLYEDGEAVDIETVRSAVKTFLSRGGEALAPVEEEEEEEDDDGEEGPADASWLDESIDLDRSDLTLVRAMADDATGSEPGTWSKKLRRACKQAIVKARKEYEG